MEIRNQYIFALGDNKENAIKVNTSEIIVFHTRDCFNNQIESEDYILDHLDWDHINPATGPVYIEEAKAGDVLKVEIIDIELENLGTMCTLPENGVLGNDVIEPQTKKLKVEEGYCYFNDLKLPINPMIGVIGVAPKGDSIPCGTPGTHGGNMDNTRITKGATLYLPVFHDGAYFACGDVHACMGDGEIMVSGVEIGAKVTLKFDVIKGCSIFEPRLEDENYIYTISSNENLEKAIYSATKTMTSIIQKHLGYSFNEAGMLLSATGHVQICQVVDPEKTVSMRIPKTVCKEVL